MATVLENLQTRYAAAVAELAALTSRPDYSVDGKSVQHAARHAALIKEIADLRALIIAEEGPIEVRIQGLT